MKDKRERGPSLSPHHYSPTHRTTPNPPTRPCQVAQSSVRLQHSRFITDSMTNSFTWSNQAVKLGHPQAAHTFPQKLVPTETCVSARPAVPSCGKSWVTCGAETFTICSQRGISPAPRLVELGRAQSVRDLSLHLCSCSTPMATSCGLETSMICSHIQNFVPERPP